GAAVGRRSPRPRTAGRNGSRREGCVMRLQTDTPYVTDREAFLIARLIQPTHPDITRRIRRGVWKRRAVISLSLVTAMAGLVLMAVGVRIIIDGFAGRGG